MLEERNQEFEPRPGTDILDQAGISSGAALSARIAALIETAKELGSYEKTFEAAAEVVPLHQKVVVPENGDLPGATVRHIPHGNSDSIEWLKVRVDKDQAWGVMHNVLQVDAVEGLIRNDGAFLVRIYENKTAWGLPLANPVDQVDADVKQLLMKAIENLYVTHHDEQTRDSLAYDSIVVVKPPTAEELEREKRCAAELNEAVREERRFGGPGLPKLKITHIRSPRRPDKID